MSRIIEIPARRIPARAAVLDLVGRSGAVPAMEPEEAELIDTLRRIFARSPAEELWEKYRGSRAASPARVARYVD